MNHYFSGFNTKEITLNATEDVTEGIAVALSDSTTVDLPSAEASFCGICTAVRNGHASVVMEGHATVAYSGTAPSIGFCKLVCDGNGGVKLSDSGREYLVVDVDEAEKTIDIIM